MLFMLKVRPRDFCVYYLSLNGKWAGPSMPVEFKLFNTREEAEATKRKMFPEDAATRARVEIEEVNR
jgi:hypothetical protein